jgi:hypothetical protein
MAVIPGIFDMSDRLHARATTSNSLSSGAIAGIVLGCIFGLALALVVLSICRCGGTFFFIARRWSRSVTDKTEKVHARANDLYTAGRDRQHQSPKLEDKTHYGDSDLEAGKNPGSSISLAPLINTPPIACVPFEHSETLGQGHSPILARRYRSSRVGFFLDGSTPPNDEKPVVVDAKRMLGFDDTSYSDGLLSGIGKHSTRIAEDNDTNDMAFQGSNTTIAPASLPVEGTSLEAPKPSLSLCSRSQANSLIRRSVIQLSSKSRGKDDSIDTTLTGREIKWRRVSELTGSERPQSPTHWTNHYDSNHSTLPPIIEMSPESTPAELYSLPPDRYSTSDYFVAGRMRRRGATRERDRESSETSAGSQYQSSHVDGVDPWDVEYHPNSIIFSHMYTSHGPNPTDPEATYISDCSSKDRDRPRSFEMIMERQPSHGRGRSDMTIQSDSTPVSQPTPEELDRWARRPDDGAVINIGDCAVDGRPDHTICSDDTLHTWRSDTENTEEDSSLSTLKSPTSFLDKGKRPCVGSVGTVELINFSASVQPKALANDTKDNHPVVFATSLCLATEYSTDCLSKHSLPGSSPPVESVTTVNSTPPTIPDADDDELPYPCPSCGVKFQTPGLRRYANSAARVWYNLETFANMSCNQESAEPQAQSSILL